MERYYDLDLMVEYIIIPCYLKKKKKKKLARKRQEKSSMKLLIDSPTYGQIVGDCRS
jgi:hypothetical protein